MISGCIPDRRTLRGYARYAAIFAWTCIFLAALLERMHRVARTEANRRVAIHNITAPHDVDPPDPEDVFEEEPDNESAFDDHPLDAET